MRPALLRPPFFVSFSVNAFSGLGLVISSKVETVMKRRPGDVGLYLRIGMTQHLPVHPSEAKGQTRHAENAQHFSRHTWETPAKISIESPSRSWTIAFFQPGRVPRFMPRRFGFDCTIEMFTRITLTLNSSSTAWRICVLCASGWTRNEYFR